MAASVVAAGAHLLLCLTVGLVIVLIARPLVTRAFGPKTTYLMWAVVPLITVGALLPAPSQSVMAIPLAQFAIPTGEAAASVTSESTDVSMWLLAVWIAGGAILAIVQWLQQRSFVRQLGTLRSLGANVYVSEAVKIGPCVVGVFPSRIVLPADFRARYTRGERGLILAHERMHLAHGDPLANLLGAIARSVFWFHPLVHVAARCFRIDQELACDAAVLERRPTEPARYAKAILSTHLAESGLPAGCQWESRTASSLRRRITMLASSSISPRRRRFGVATVCACLVASAGVTWAAKSPLRVAALPDNLFYRLTIRISKDDTLLSTPIITVKAGEVALWSDPTYTVMMVPKPHGPDQVSIAMLVKKDQNLVATPSVMIGNKLRAEIRVDGFAVQVTAEPQTHSLKLNSADDVILGKNGRRPLVLVDGKPLPPSIEAKSIPLATIQRIEVLPTDSPMVVNYGPSAANGVVNLILRDGSD